LHPDRTPHNHPDNASSRQKGRIKPPDKAISQAREAKHDTIPLTKPAPIRQQECCNAAQSRTAAPCPAVSVRYSRHLT
jgi:hypothetical protein